MKNSWEEAAVALNKGQIAVIPTDTIYGIVAKASDKNAVEKIHHLKSRSANKPFIILVSSKEQLQQFSIEKDWTNKTQKYWPGPYSLIFPIKDKKYDYLTCGLKTLAFRLPAMDEMIELINKTGPLVAPSANPEGLPLATNIEQAKNYFKDKVDIYIDGGDLSNNKPSALIDLATSRQLR